MPLRFDGAKQIARRMHPDGSAESIGQAARRMRREEREHSLEDPPERSKSANAAPKPKLAPPQTRAPLKTCVVGAFQKISPRQRRIIGISAAVVFIMALVLQKGRYQLHDRGLIEIDTLTGRVWQWRTENGSNNGHWERLKDFKR